MDNTQPQSEPTQSQIAFQNQTNAMAHHLMGFLVTAGVPPLMVGLAMSQIIRACVIELSRHNADVAKALLEDLAMGIVDLTDQLNAEPAQETKQ